MEKYDLIIVGAGPAGIFTAVELFRRGAHKKILMVEKGQSVEKRSCPKSKTQKCVNCQPCNITTGFSGAGAFSDGKLSLNHEVGGDFPNLVGPDFAQSLIDYTDQIYLEFGADPHVEGVSDPDKIRIIRRRAIRAGLKLVDCPIRHLGTEKAQELYLALENDLRAKGVDMLFGHSCVDLVLDGPLCKGVIVEPTRGGTRETIYADDVVIAAGRRGAEWLESLCAKYDIAHQPGTVDIGALTPDGELDLVQMRRMMACAGQMEVTLHRAFDMTRDPFRALEDAVSLGCRTILSSGQAANAALGAPLLAKLNGQAAGRIDLMAGCGVKRTNIAGIAAQTGITTFHTTGRKGSVDSGMRYRKEGVSMGLPSLSEYELWLTDEAEFRACAETVHALGTPGAQA